MYGILSECVKILTNIRDVERKPVQEGVADQFGEKQAEREFHHSLCEKQDTMKTTGGTFL